MVASRWLIAFALLLCALPTARAEENDYPEAYPQSSARWNEYDGGLFTLRAGFGLLYDSAAYLQDIGSGQQMNLSSTSGLRDFRLVAKGKFKFAPRFSYTIGYMWDAPNQVWRFRQTGLIIDVPELGGNLFLGRTKEGFSTSKIMVGYNGWVNERSAANDAFLPILADGIKWTGQGFGNKLVYNLGWFNNTWTNYEPYVKNDMHWVARAVWLPLSGTGSGSVLHLAFEGRYATAKDGELQFKSKPESYLAQSFAVDTGKFAAGHNTMAGFEAYYRPGPLMFGSEYFLNWVTSSEEGNPFFHGGEIFAAYMLTGEIRKYNEKAAIFEGITPEHSVDSGGPGAWELVLRYSYIDLDSGAIQGGKFWRITPMVNWHMSNTTRLELVYGYSGLDRGGITGYTSYFQSRLQLQLM
jgi:phosphate-selective porin OprO/OprP